MRDLFQINPLFFTQYPEGLFIYALPWTDGYNLWTDLRDVVDGPEGRCFLLCKTIDGLEENVVDKIVGL